MERTKTRKISEILKEFLSVNKLDVRLKERQIIEGWEELMGKTISKSTKKIYIKERRLFVETSSSVVRNELFMLRKEIVQKLNERVGADIITELVLR